MVMEIIKEVYENVVYSLPAHIQFVPKLIIFSLIIAAYGIFIWLFYRFLARRDILRLNLKKYNKFELAWLIKLFAIIFYIVEFIIFLPFVITFWFGVLAILLLVLVRSQDVQTILFIAAAIIGATRITAYYSEDLSKDLAKMFPFTLLSAALLTTDFFDISTIIPKIQEIPLVLDQVIYFAVFIIAIELVLRSFYLVYSIFSSPEEKDEKEEDK